MRDIPVLQAKRFGVYSCRLDDSLKHAADTMTNRNISCLVVVDEHAELKGIITCIDLVRAAYWEPKWAQGRVQDYMNPNVVTVNLDDKLQRVMELLIDRHIHRVVAVREENGRKIPMGVLSAADVVYHMSKE
jgi:signal-transduction protein with cAMP-binding, CBS, and nucleotidyltransferase domain